MSPTKTVSKKATAKKTVTKKPPAKKAAKKAAEHPFAAMVGTCRELAALVETHGLSELTLEAEGTSLSLRRGGYDAPTTVAVSPLPTTATSVEIPSQRPVEAVTSQDHLITSPFVGTFYRAASPDAAPYCEVGQRVEKGQVLCIVEAMKLMNEIEADEAGIIEAALVENAAPVEYGQALFRIRP